MNILMLSSSLWPYGSGGELATYLYATLLHASGLRVIVLVSDRNVPSRQYTFKVIHLPSYTNFGKYSLHVDGKLLKKLIAWADIVYFASAFWNLIPLTKRFSKPVVVHLHSYDPVCPVGSLYNFTINCTCIPEYRTCRRCVWLYERLHQRDLTRSAGSLTLNSLFGAYFAKLLNYVDALVFVSNAHRDLSLSHLTCILDTTPKSYVIHNPIPEIHYIPPNGSNVGYFGGLSPLKGFHILMKAWLRVWRRYPDVRLFATKMAKLANSSILRKVNVITYDKLSSDEFNRLLSGIGIVVFPSIWQEPLPYVVIESLLYGKLLIASRVGGVPEIVDNVPGVKLIPPGDVDAFADALDWALSMDRKDIIELGLKNREYALRKFDNERTVRELIRIFEKVLSR